MRNGDGSLLRAIESGISSAPRTVRSFYQPDELVNSVFLLLKSRRVRKPTRLQIRSAVIDIHRRDTHYPRRWKFGMAKRKPPELKQLRCVPEDAKIMTSPSSSRAEVADSLRDVRRRFGTDGLCMFLLSRVLELPSKTVAEIMDYAPDSALAKSVAEVGAEL